MVTRMARKKGGEEDEDEEEDARDMENEQEDAHEDEELLVFYIGAGVGAAADETLREAAAVRAYGQCAAQQCSRR
eukprot:3618910-Pyramimonas_sp.AAC.1